jgi:hypothetical protein
MGTRQIFQRIRACGLNKPMEIGLGEGGRGALYYQPFDLSAPGKGQAGKYVAGFVHD